MNFHWFFRLIALSKPRKRTRAAERERRRKGPCLSFSFHVKGERMRGSRSPFTFFPIDFHRKSMKSMYVCFSSKTDEKHSFFSYWSTFTFGGYFNLKEAQGVRMWCIQLRAFLVRPFFGSFSAGVSLFSCIDAGSTLLCYARVRAKLPPFAGIQLVPFGIGSAGGSCVPTQDRQLGLFLCEQT